jgi:hypothetical protein
VRLVRRLRKIAVTAPAISGDAFADKPAYVGKSLHVAVTHGSKNPRYTVWTNDGDEPIATCVDSGTAHLLVAASDLLEALRAVHDEVRDYGPEPHHSVDSFLPDFLKEKIRIALAKAAP